MSPHACPGRCGRMVRRGRLGCRSCWNRLPDRYQRAVRETYARLRRNRADTDAAAGHRVAIADAVAWFDRRAGLLLAAGPAACTTCVGTGYVQGDRGWRWPCPDCNAQAMNPPTPIHERK